jgi:hypothetical protein
MAMEYVVVQHVWPQTSANYDAERATRTMIVGADTTVAQVMEWARSGQLLGRGDVVLTEAARSPAVSPRTAGE